MYSSTEPDSKGEELKTTSIYKSAYYYIHFYVYSEEDPTLVLPIKTLEIHLHGSRCLCVQPAARSVTVRRRRATVGGLSWRSVSGGQTGASVVFPPHDRADTAARRAPGACQPAEQRRHSRRVPWFHF